jgi:hypothetical protein
MTIPATNSKLLVTEDWKKIYQSYQNAEFQSYDFDTLRRILISYLQENFPEDFNDFIESSEYIALVDLIAYLGQNLSFRIDLNARENFLETAQRRDSILRLAQLVSYVPKRNVPASGLLKISAISTTENVYDSAGNNITNNTIVWNDSTNINWYSQFLNIINSAMPGGMVFGIPNDSSVINGIQSEQYLINSSNIDVPIYSFTQNINGSNTVFEIVSSTFSGQNFIYEDTPRPGNSFKIIYQNDNQGSSSANTGFYVLFKQGTLGFSSFSLINSVPNEIIGINVNNINNTDVWLWQLDAANTYTSLWKKTPSVVGNNIIYNSLSAKDRNVYSVSTRDQDQIDLNFSDGVFGNLPNGQFQLFYRQSNGLSYSITQEQLSGISVTIPYVDKSGVNQNLTLVLSLEYTVSNSSPTESNAVIQRNAPQTFYTQNRMITAEDYNIAPLTYTTNVLKIKSINRISSGVSKYFDLSDVSGKYSKTNIFCDDGIIAKNTTSTSFTFSFYDQNKIWSTIKNYLLPTMAKSELTSFYLDVYRNFKPIIVDPALNITWNLVNNAAGQSRGYFLGSNINSSQLFPQATQQGSPTLDNPLYYVSAGAMIKLKAPVDATSQLQQYFLPDGSLTVTPTLNTTEYFWTNVQQVIGTGNNNGLGALSDGTGPIILTNTVPDNCSIIEIVPQFINSLDYNFQSDIVNLCLSYQTFGLRFDSIYRIWKIIYSGNINTNIDFSNTGLSSMFDTEGDNTNANKDSSWMILFNLTSPKTYTITSKLTQYIFQSASQTGFYIDSSNVNFDYTSNSVIKDKISVLSINTKPQLNSLPLNSDYVWQITGSIVQDDGYVDPSVVLLGFYTGILPDSLLASTVNPESFTDIVGTFADASTEISIGGNVYTYPGRAGLKFHYEHNPSENVRVDPAKSNIIDIYMLTADYDAKFRNWLSTGAGAMPLPPTTQSLENNYSADLDPIKAISDQIIYQPASYKILFGNYAESKYQATFKVVKSDTSTLSDNAVRSQILDGINQFFALDNWDFGQYFHFSELATYIMNLLTPNITNFLLVPLSSGFGNLYEVACQSNEIFISGATAENIQIIPAATASQLKIGT